MATLRQLAANRENALKSTGPATPEGKQRSKMNAQMHGYAALGFHVPQGLEDEFDRMQSDLNQEWDPRGETERQAVQRFLHASWNLFLIGRDEAACREVAERAAAANPELGSWVNTPEEEWLRKLARYRAAHERSQRQSLSMLLRLRRARLDNAERRKKAERELDRMTARLDKEAAAHDRQLERMLKSNMAAGAERTQLPDGKRCSFEEFVANEGRNILDILKEPDYRAAAAQEDDAR